MSKVLLKLGYKNKEDLHEKGRLTLRIVDIMIHRHVLFGNIVDSDEELAEFLIDLVLGYLDLK